MPTYYIAVRLDRRDSIPANWRDRMTSIPGLAVTGGAATRLEVEATDDAIAQVKANLGDYLHIEEPMDRGLAP